jgi:hypothetical protein
MHKIFRDKIAKIPGESEKLSQRTFAIVFISSFVVDFAGAASCGGPYEWRVVWLTGVARFLKHTIAFFDKYSKYEISRFPCGIFLIKILGIRLISVLRSIHSHLLSLGD